MKEIKVLMLTNFLCVSAMMAFLSVVGPIIRELNMEEWHAGLVVALAGVLWVALSRFWGKKSDVVGRKPILFIGVLGVAVFYFIMAVYIDYALVNTTSVIISLIALLFTRGLMGAFFSAIAPVSNALIADHVVKEKRTAYIAKLAGSSGLAMIIGPVIGGYLSSFGLSTPLYIFAFLPLIALFLIYFVLENEKPKKEEVSIPKLFDKRLRLPMFASFITMFAIISSQVCLGFYILDKFSLESIEASKITGYILASIGVFFILSQVLVSKVKIKDLNLLKYGAFIACLGYIIVAFMNSIDILVLGFCIGVFGIGMLFPAFQSLALNLVTKEEQGAAAGTVSASQGMGIIIAPLVSTLIYEFNPIYPFILVSFVFFILGLISFFTKEIKC